MDFCVVIQQLNISASKIIHEQQKTSTLE